MNLRIFFGTFLYNISRFVFWYKSEGILSALRNTKEYLRKTAKTKTKGKNEKNALKKIIIFSNNFSELSKELQSRSKKSVKKIFLNPQLFVEFNPVLSPDLECLYEGERLLIFCLDANYLNDAITLRAKSYESRLITHYYSDLDLFGPEISTYVDFIHNLPENQISNLRKSDVPGCFLASANIPFPELFQFFLELFEKKVCIGVPIIRHDPRRLRSIERNNITIHRKIGGSTNGFSLTFRQMIQKLGDASVLEVDISEDWFWYLNSCAVNPDVNLQKTLIVAAKKGLHVKGGIDH